MSVILRAYNSKRLIYGKPATVLTDDFASGGSTLTVDDIDGFAVGQMILLGQLGEERSLVTRVSTGTAPSGTTITLNAAVSKSFPIGTPVTVFDYDQVEFSRATTIDGSPSVLTTVSIAANSMQTIYEDTTNTTGFGFYRFKNSASSAFSPYSDPIPYAGYEDNAVQTIVDQALTMAASSENPRMTIDTLIQFVNDFIAELRSRDYRWADTLVYNHILANLEPGVWEFDLPEDIVRKNDPSSIVELRVLDYPKLTYVDQLSWSKLLRETRVAQLTASITSLSTTIVLDNSYAFPDEGSVMIGGDTNIAYTGNTRSTGTLTGVTGIVDNHSTGDYVFSRQITNVPGYYTISESGKVRVWPIPDGSVENLTLYLTHFKKLPTVEDVGDTITVQDTKAAIQYVSYRIKKFIEGGRVNPQDEDLQIALADINRISIRDIGSVTRRIKLR